MPAGDGTGPVGLGPMTGRGLGYCAGYMTPGYMNNYYGPEAAYMGTGYGPGYVPGRGLGFGRGFGRGYGRGFAFGPRIGRGLRFGRGFGYGAGYGRGRGFARWDFVPNRFYGSPVFTGPPVVVSPY